MARLFSTFLLSFVCLSLSYAGIFSPSFQPDLDRDLCILEEKQDCPKKKKECKGVRKYDDGSVYDGEFTYGEPNGMGTLTLSNGNKYVGQFQDGLRSGNGKMEYTNGDIFEGEWATDKKHGAGTYTWADGTKYVGNYFEGVMQGEGTITLKNGESYEGEWKAGVAHGEGTYSAVDGSTHRGKYKYGKREGSGVITWRSGDVFIGKWKDGKTSKTGSFQFMNGDRMMCIWEDGEMIGQGTYVKENGVELKGNLKQLEAEIEENDNLKEAIGPNLATAWYTVAMEYKYQKNFKKSLEALQEAGKFVPPSSNMGQLIYEQTEIINERVKKEEGL